MKTRNFVIAIFILAISNNLSAQGFDFRNTKWGEDTTQVKRVEKAKLAYSKNNTLIYYGKLSDLNAEIFYEFNSFNQLYRASYNLTLESRNPSLYIKNFLMFQELLTKKYNEPYSRSTSTVSGKVITQDEWASNLISDNLNLETKWKTVKTEIILALYSINDQLYIEISYASIEYSKKIDEEKKSNLLKDL